MRKTLAVFLLLTLCFFLSHSVLLFAQEEDYGYHYYDWGSDYYEEPQSEWIGEDDEYEDPGYGEWAPGETDWEGYIPELYSMGDQVFGISIGVIFPIVFYRDGKVDHNFFPVGGTGSLAYNYFLGNHLFVGAEAGIKFNYTLAKNVIFFIPVGIRAGWQFIVRRLEFPLTFTMGVVPQRYQTDSYVGFFMRGAAGAYYRFNPNWSFGLNTDWSWYPQWPKTDGNRDKDKDTYANIIGITLSARYHF
jgi:hypothetical protein